MVMVLERAPNAVRGEQADVWYGVGEKKGNT
jgi:hypothetical protein